MKYRKHFVTNSSSSCFIAVYQGEETCINEVKQKVLKEQMNSYIIGEEGNLEFGWTQEVFDDFDSRLNFVALQTLIQSDNYKKMDFSFNPDAEKVLEIFKGAEDSKMGKLVNEVFEDEIGIPLDWNGIKIKKASICKAYIDHQSCDYPPMMFNSKSEMHDFLFGKKSAIIMGNDNTYEDEGEFHHLEEDYLGNSDFKTEFL